jgi:hypothetical protein
MPDLVLLCDDPNHPDGGIAICVEPQGKRDPFKRWVLPFYQATIARQYERPTWMAVIAFETGVSRAIGRWSCGDPPRVDALLFDTQTVPVPRSLSIASERPTAAVLAAALHGCKGNIDAVRLGISACNDLPRQTRIGYLQTMLASLSVKRRKLIESELPMEDQDDLWDIEKRGAPYRRGRQEGRKEGRQEGRQEGRAEEARRILRQILEQRRIGLSAAHRELLENCTELTRLERWLTRSLTATRAEQIFA